MVQVVPLLERKGIAAQFVVVPEDVPHPQLGFQTLSQVDVAFASIIAATHAVTQRKDAVLVLHGSHWSTGEGIGEWLTQIKRKFREQSYCANGSSLGSTLLARGGGA